ncbi:MAG: hypothetical protein WCQ47_01645 [bacterium]
MDSKDLYKGQLQGDTLIIGTRPPLLPLKGVAEYVDWRLNALISRLIVEKKFTATPLEKLLLPCNEIHPINKVIVVGIDNKTKIDIPNVLMGLESDLCSIILPQDFQEDAVSMLGWKKLDSKNLNNEKLIIISKN